MYLAPLVNNKVEYIEERKKENSKSKPPIKWSHMDHLVRSTQDLSSRYHLSFFGSNLVTVTADGKSLYS